MDTPTAFTIFFIVFFIQWFYAVYQCEKEIFVTRNKTSLDHFNDCIKAYSSKGLPYLLELTSALLEETFTKTVAFFIWVFDQKSSIIIFILFGLVSYGAVNRQSDAFQTLSDVFHILRDDLSKVAMEIWSSFKYALVSLYQVITVAKFIEIVIIGLFLSSVSELFDFVSKTFSKVLKKMENFKKSVNENPSQVKYRSSDHNPLTGQSNRGSGDSCSWRPSSRHKPVGG